MTHDPDVPAEPRTSVMQAAGWSYFPIAFLARLPFAMNVVGVLTLVVAVRGSLTLGGVTSAVLGIATAIAGPFLGAAADRFGQRPVLLLAAVANSAALVLLAVIAPTNAPEAAVLGAAALIGATAPQVSPMSRSRLVSIIQERIAPARRSRATISTLAYESSVDEIVFVFGPVIVGVLAVLISPAAPLYGSAALTLIAVGAFALHPSAQMVHAHQVATAADRAPARDLFRPGILVLVAGMLAVGLFFGATLTSLTSFMRDLGDGESAGVFYGIMGVGSAILALSVAIMPARFTPRSRWIVFSIILVIGTTLIGRSTTTTDMIIALAITGIGVGPLIVTIYDFTTARMPVGRSATVMTMVGAGVVVGQSLASAAVGALAQDVGTAPALWTPLVAAALVLAMGIVNFVLARPHRR